MILTRAVHIGACLLLFGLLAFDRLVAGPAVIRVLPAYADPWAAALRRWSVILLAIIVLSGLAWFALVARTVSGLSWPLALRSEILSTVWLHTDFGIIWRIRLFIWSAAAVAVALPRLSSPPWLRRTGRWAALIVSAALLGSLAWAGHGRDGPSWHLPADVAHLLVAGCWPTGLLPLAVLIRRLRRDQSNSAARGLGNLVRRFSAVSLGSVSALVATGWLNTVVMVGSFSNLVHDAYGRWLLFKIFLFGAAVALGAVNLLRLKPLIVVERAHGAKAGPAVLWLQRSVRWELVVGMAIVVVVAILGILPPAAR